MAESEPTRPGSANPDDVDRAGEVSATDRLRSEAAARQSELESTAEEQVRWSGGYSPRTMLGAWIGLVLLTVAAVVATLLADGRVPWAVTGIGVLILWAVVAAIYASRRLGVYYELTTQRFMHQTGILSRRTDRIEVIDIDDVSFEQGLVQRMVGVGTIHITSSDRSHPQLSMPGIANVREVAGLIDDIRRKERRRRSLHIESI